VFSVRCKHEGTEGLYDLTMVMTTEAAVTGGRETFGEPKKLGQVTLDQDDNGHVVGKVTRNGVTYLEVPGATHYDPIPAEWLEKAYSALDAVPGPLPSR